MNEQSCRVGDIELCYESLGDPEQPTVLLIMGLGLAMDWWCDDFCTALVARGFHVVRFDNRDVGRSTHLAGRSISAWEFLTRRAHPDYTLGDMADDAAGLVAALDPCGAHVVGASLGGMIAQEVAIRHPALTRSLVSIMARPGDGRTGKVAWRMRAQFLRPPSADPVETMVRSLRRIGSVGRTERDDEDVRIAMYRSMRRSGGVDGRSAGAARDDHGAGRQLAACVAERNRTADLRRLPMPTLVLHGAADKVILPSGGRATAAAIPNAELVEVSGMGHDLPRWVWPTLIDGITRTTARTTSPT